MVYASPDFLNVPVKSIALPLSISFCEITAFLRIETVHVEVSLSAPELPSLGPRHSWASEALILHTYLETWLGYWPGNPQVG